MTHRILKKLLTIILILALLPYPGHCIKTKAESSRTKQFQSDKAIITITAQSEWQDGYIAEITIQNKKTVAIENWKVSASMSGTIENIWNAEQEKNGKIYTFTNAGWNRNIKAGETISFGIKVRGAAFDDIADVVLKENQKEAKTDGYAVEYNITSQWENHAIIEAIIHNTGEEELTNWSLTIQFKGDIVDLWNADKESVDGSTYIISCKDYNAVISKNASVSFGMKAEYPDNQIECPSNNSLQYLNKDKATNIAEETTEPDMEEPLQIDWNDKTDTDQDGLPDVMEQYRHFSDSNKKDTDEDGLEDGYEVEIGTEPAIPDTDEDGLSDGEEISIYGTDPLKEDSDRDGLPDGDEITLKLNPLKPDTDEDGILDGEEYIQQSIDRENIDSSLYDDNDAIPTAIKAKARGNINRSIEITEYNGCLAEDDPACIGKPILLEELEMETGTIQFTLTKEYEAPEYQINKTNTSGLLICYHDSKEGNTIPLETEYNPKNRTLTAPISRNGIYFVLDAVAMLSEFGINLEETTGETGEMQRTAKTVGFTQKKVVGKTAGMKQTADNTTGIMQEATVKGKADIIFVVDTTESMDYYIANVKYNLNAFVGALNKAGISASYALVEYKDITADGKNSTKIKKNGSTCWNTNIEKLKKEIDKLSVKGGGDLPETPIDALEKARRIKTHKTAEKYIVLITDGEYKTDNSYGIESMEEMTDRLQQDGITVSVISHEYRKNDYKTLYQKTGGIFAAVDRNFKDNLLGIADNIGGEVNDGYWIALDGLTPQAVRLEEKPSRNGTADTDGDTLLDREELASLTPTKYIKVEPYLKALKVAVDGINYKIPVYEYGSKPTSKDSDNDGIKDQYDNRPRTKGIYSAKENKIVLGKMTIVSCDNNVIGHAFLVYKSYVNDTLDFRKFTGGYEYKTWKSKKPCKYKIKCSEYVAIGNAGKGLSGKSDLDETEGEVNDGDNAGVYFNREFAKEHARGKAIYDRNYAYSREISGKQLKKIIKTCEDENYYHLYDHNCAMVAAMAWNKAYPNDKFKVHVFPAILKNEIWEKEKSFKFDMAKEVPNIR